MVSIILKPVIIGTHSLCPQLSPDLFSKSIIEQPSVPLPPLMVQIFSSLSSSLAVARGSMPDCPSQRRRQREGEGEGSLSPLSSLPPCQRCMAYFIQEKRRESEMLLGGWGFLQDLKNT